MKSGVAGGAKGRTRLLVIRWSSLPQAPIPLPQDNSLGSQLQYLRRCLGETRSTFATLCKHPVSLIAKYEKNKIKTPNTQVLLDFAKALKVSPEKLISIQCFQPISNNQEFEELVNHLIAAEKDFGSKFRSLRLRANIEQKALAREVGINRESIRRYERNITKPNKTILARIIEALKDSSRRLQEKYYHNKGADSSKFGINLEEKLKGGIENGHK